VILREGPPGAPGWEGRNGRLLEFFPDALKRINAELATRTRTALAQSITAAAEAAAQRQEPLPVGSTAQLRELTGAAARTFGWDTDREPSTVHNTLVITQEQLEQIRALRAEEGENE
jgi:hypothetical protein